MGNSESSNPVRNMDKRTARREYRTDFMRAIANCRKRLPPPIKSKGNDDWADGNIKVFVRKRPIFKHELDAHEFDVATCTGVNKIVVHDARMHNDMKRQLMNHHEFQFDRTFDENVKNDEVYAATAKSLVEIACNGGYSTCLVYGQTGSGKTFTMSSIYEHAAYDIFNQLDALAERFSVPPTVSMSFFEIAGDFCHDLLNRFSAAQLLTGTDGSVHAFPVVEPTVTCAEELIAMIQHGMGVRTTAATGVHDQSSRSHAVLRIYIQRHDLRVCADSSVATGGGSSGTFTVEGSLTLVDLAGSEHKIDSMYHGKERRKETGNINASLMALKDCIRARAEGKLLSFQYRRSKLTQALKCSFSLPSARTIVIATVSPASKDTEHSLNTLRHACIMHGQQDHSGETRFVTGGSVTSELIGEINLTEIGRKNANIKRSGGVMDGPKTDNGNNVADSRAARAANNEVELTEKDRLRLRKAAEVRSISKLLPQYRELLRHYREQLGRNRHQAARLQRPPLDPNAILEEDGAAYESPMQSPGRGEDEEVGEVDEEVQEFHSSLTKNQAHRPRLDLHGYAISGRDSVVDSDVEEEEVEEELPVRRAAKGSESPGAGPSLGARSRPGSAAALKRVNSSVRASYQEEVAGGGGASAYSPRVPQLHSQAGKAALLHVRRPPSATPPAAVEVTPPRPSPSSSSAVPRPSPGTQRIEFQRLYDTIYAAGAEGVPEHVLRRQLTSLLTLHGYSEREIDMMFDMQALIQENAAMKRAAEGKPSSGQSKPAAVVRVSPRPTEERKLTRQASAPVVNSPPVDTVKKGHVKHSPPRPAPPVVEANAPAPLPKRSASVARPTVAPAPSAPQARQQAAERDRRAAEDKERREREAVAEAAVQLEQQAAIKRSRQEAARLLREQQDEERRQRAARNAAESKATKQSVTRAVPAASEAISSRRPAVGMEDYPISTANTAAACRASIKQHEDEITSLVDQLQSPGNTEAVRYALRKNIAVRKAALLRERREAAQKSFLDDDGVGDSSPPSQPAAAMKGATRYAAPAPRAPASVQNSPPNPSAQKQVYLGSDRPAESSAGGGGFQALRPQPHSFDDVPVGGSGRSPWSDPSQAPPGREYGAPPRVGGRDKGPVSQEADAFGGPRWGSDADHFLSPRSPGRSSQSAGQGQGQGQGQGSQYSPSQAERAAARGRRAVGAAAAPFGNDYV